MQPQTDAPSSTPALAPEPRDPLAALRPSDVAALCRHFDLPTPTPDVSLAVFIRQRGLTPEGLYADLSGTTSIPLMIAAHALVTGPRRLPPDPRLNPAPLPPCGGERPPLRSGEKIPRARYTKPERTAADPEPTVVPPDTAVLIRVAPNPKKPGTKTWVDYEKYKIGMTVGELRKLGWRTSNLAWDVGHGFVEFAPAATSTTAGAEPPPPQTPEQEQAA
jgi:hypothetical protein